MPYPARVIVSELSSESAEGDPKKNKPYGVCRLRLCLMFPAEYPPQHPDRIQLYSVATPNGKKVGVMLEETGLPYEAHPVNILEGDQHKAGYARINPNEKIPSILDPKGPDGRPLAIMESGAILLYLAQKAGKFYPKNGRHMSETLQWLFFQMASVGPMFGQFGHFYKFAKGKTDSYGQERYTTEVKRLLGVLDDRLKDRDYIVGDYGIVDMATLPWIEALDFYEGKDAVDYPSFQCIHRWATRVQSRPPYQRGTQINPI